MRHSGRMPAFVRGLIIGGVAGYIVGLAVLVVPLWEIGHEAVAVTALVTAFCIVAYLVGEASSPESAR